jgi:uncharacterized surface protein with fasciclin (FAS1) repeats
LVCFSKYKSSTALASGAAFEKLPDEQKDNLNDTSYVKQILLYHVIKGHHLKDSFHSETTWRGVLDTTLCNKVCQLLSTCRWFSLGTPVFSTNKTDLHDITNQRHVESN